MNISNFNKGILCSSFGSFWWGLLGTYYFQYISFVGTLEVVIHRCIWTALILLLTTFFFNKWHFLKEIFVQKKKIIILLITSMLIFGNWTIWIYAVSTNRIIDASFGYFIFPILSIFFGFLFFDEKLNRKRILSILIVIISTIFLLFNLHSFPWVGFAVALLWSVYNLLSK